VASIILAQAFGTSRGSFVDGLLNQLANASVKEGKVDEHVLNSMIALVASFKPQDELEATLAAQMAVVHVALMNFARRLNQVETLQQQHSAERAFNKLARTFTTQVEALKRYGTGGEQKVTVKHVTVNSGGQAIVGNVSHGGESPVPQAAPCAVITAGEETPLSLLPSSLPEVVYANGGGGNLKKQGLTS
jgi:hypothetical protein